MRSRLNTIRDWNSLAKTAKYKPHVLAQICKVSVRQLERYFMGRFRQAPQAWLNQIRSTEAARLLNSGAPIKQIAYDLGFADVSHFHHAFKRRYRCTPIEFISCDNSRAVQIIDVSAAVDSAGEAGINLSPSTATYGAY
jgi:AraC-like DNA-binding protein